MAVEEDGLFPPRLPWYGLLDHFHDVTCDWGTFPTSGDITDDADCGFPPGNAIGNSPAALPTLEDAAGTPAFPVREPKRGELETGGLCDFKILGVETLIGGAMAGFVPLSPTPSEVSRGEVRCGDALVAVANEGTNEDAGP